MDERKNASENYAASIRSRQETHVACILLLDTSDSMNYPVSDPPINRLNEAMKVFKEEGCKDEVSKNTIDVAVVEFNSKVNVVSGFTPMAKLTVPQMRASGCTSMGEALVKAIEMAKERTRNYQLVGTDAWTPWIVMVTDGEPTDDMAAAKELLEEEKKKGKYGHIRLWIIATKGANLKLCKELTNRVILLNDQDYREIFNWTRESLAIMSVSRPGEHVKAAPLPPNAQVVLDEWMNSEK